ncbi:MAG: DEAD/DEAH box helicase, partial [Bacilli bacterium]
MQIINSLLGKYEHGKVGLSGLTDDLLVVYLKKIYQENKRNIILVTSTLFEANKIYQLMIKEIDKTLLFPMDDFLTSEALAISPDLKVSRLETINTISDSSDNHVIVTHLMGYLRYLPNKKEWQKSIISLSKGDDISKDLLVRKLYKIGYTNETIVNKTGEIGTRGYIVDIFPVNESNPIRIEFWGDTIDSIRYFDLDSQLSIKETNNIKIYPFDEFISDELIDIDKKQKYLPLYTTPSKISDYMEEPLVVYIDYNQIKNAYLMLREEIFNYHSQQKDKYKTDYMHFLEKIDYDDEIYVMNIDNVLPDIKLKAIEKYDVKKVYQYNTDTEQLLADLEAFIHNGKTVVICLRNDNQINSIKSFLKGHSIVTDEDHIIEKRINIIQKDIGSGFIIANYVFLSEKDLFQKVDSKPIYKSKFKYGSKIKDVSKLSVGDYVVHQTHGIGIYCGIEALIKNGIKKDYLLIKYKGNDKLYIPVEKIDLIWKYSSNDGLSPSLNQLGGTEWQKTKLRIKKRLNDIVGALLAIAAEREATRGFAFSPDSGEQIKFEKDFIYDETMDQLLVTRQIKDDMEKEMPMDRLLCGDVGYGKTEVAFRAIFKAVSSGKQGAYLCPTTLLSSQQYKNASSRFKNYAVSIAILNRFTTKKDLKKTLEGLKNGTIDIVFGTHRLLSNDVMFKSLGLLIIDEEQRFGVIHKEKIKEYKSNIDVLTLSATPIPRTLQMAMVGLRGLSLIETPPVNRYPVQTYVLEENNHIIKEAIYKELSRKGQIYILFNSVEKIERKVKELSELVKDARITYAHG